MNAKEARHALAEDIGMALGPAWTVYASPESVNAPAIVLAPGSPYRVRSTVCNEEVRFLLSVLIQRASSIDGLDTLDDACTAISAAIHASDVMSVVEAVQSIGPVVEVGAVPYLSATLNVTSQI